MSLEIGFGTPAHHFDTTHWSVVLAAGNGPTEQADAALEKLCHVYWWPLYAFVRRRGHTPHDAQDLTQEFFARLLAKDFLYSVDRSKGRFRSFLLGALEHFLANEWRNAHAQKRGGKFKFISLNDTTAEEQYQHVPGASLTAEKCFEQQWAITLLDQAVARLREEFVAAEKGPTFDVLKIFLTGEKRAASYGELAIRLQTTEAALKMSVSRMRRRYGELLRAEIGNTVNDPAEVESELRALFTALSG